MYDLRLESELTVSDASEQKCNVSQVASGELVKLQGLRELFSPPLSEIYDVIVTDLPSFCQILVQLVFRTSKHHVPHRILSCCRYEWRLDVST